MKISIRTIVWAFVILAMILAGVMAMIPGAVNVEVATASDGVLKLTVREDGKTRIREKYTVSAPVSGRLARIELQSGDEILCDETLLAVILPSNPAILDARSQAEATARVNAAVATVKRSKANMEQAKINHQLCQSKFERAEKLFPKKGISKDEFDSAQAEYLDSVQGINAAVFDADIAQFELEMAQAAISQFSDDEQVNSAEPFEIAAPVSGKVLRVFQESAAVVSVGTPLLELGDPQHLEIEIDVLSTDAVQIKPGAELTVEHWGGDAPLKGTVRVVEPAAFTKVSSLGVEEQRVNVIADFTEPVERIVSLGDGYRVEARVTVAEKPNVLRIPNSALFRHERLWHVFTVVDNRAQMQQVDIGVQNESHAEILTGLSSGDQVVVYPSDQIQSGTLVRIQN